MPVTLESHGRVALLTLDRPEALNVLSAQMLDDLEARLAEVGADPEVRVVVLTGAGDRAFSAGADVKSMRDAGAAQGRALAARGQGVAARIASFPVPVVAAINGYCLGGGCEIALACDVRVASEAAQIALPEVTLGIVPGWGGTQRLTRLVGLGLAKEMVVTGRRVGAEEALRHGLVTHVFEHAALRDHALALAADIAARPPLSVAIGRELVEEAAGDLTAGLAHERDAFGWIFSTEDKAEGVAAFLDKRPGEFRGR